jgi:hypothetical protein
MKLLDEDLLAEGADDVVLPGELGEEDGAFLKILEEMADEVKDDANSID